MCLDNVTECLKRVYCYVYNHSNAVLLNRTKLVNPFAEEPSASPCSIMYIIHSDFKYILHFVCNVSVCRSILDLDLLSCDILTRLKIIKNLSHSKKEFMQKFKCHEPM